MRHSWPWRAEAVLRRHKLLTKYGLLWPMRFRARMVQRGEFLTPEQWRIHALDSKEMLRRG